MKSSEREEKNLELSEERRGRVENVELGGVDEHADAAVCDERGSHALQCRVAEGRLVDGISTRAQRDFVAGFLSGRPGQGECRGSDGGDTD